MIGVLAVAGSTSIDAEGDTIEEAIDALEYLLNRIVGRGEERARITLDAEEYRRRRESELREMAARLAAQVCQTGREQALSPMSARERRIVHLSLRTDPTVTTQSLGEGDLRRVVIRPGQPSPSRPPSRHRS